MLNIKCFSFNPICVNTYVVYNESKDCVIIDAGNCNLREDNVLFDFIEKNQLKPIMILNTHAHFDHILGNYATAQKYQIPLASHPDGDEYFKINSPDHNLIRARAQMKLLTEIEAKYDEMVEYVDSLIKK